MRLLIAMVPRDQGYRALEVARQHGATNLGCFQGIDAGGEIEVVLIHAPNDKLDPLLAELTRIDQLRLTLIPQGVIALRPPASEAPDQALDVTHRSPVEIFLSGLQSIGSWKGFLGYALAAGVVVWIGLYTNTVYLLTAAMLIAPFAGPAMNLALGTARGDKTLIGRSVLRYFASILAAILVAWLLSFLLGQQIATQLMVQTSFVSSVTVLLPLVAGAAGALHLCQSERSSLVTAAGTGMLVAASLAPPAGVIGMATALGEWGMVKSGAFVLLLQLVGINFSGTLVFAAFGLSPQGVRFDRGRGWLRRLSWTTTTVGIAILLIWQFWNEPNLQRSTREQRIEQIVKQTLQESQLANPIDVEARFTRADVPQQNSLLIIGYLQRKPGRNRSDAEIKDLLTEQIHVAIAQGGFNVTPLVTLNVLREPTVRTEGR